MLLASGIGHARLAARRPAASGSRSSAPSATWRRRITCSITTTAAPSPRLAAYVVLPVVVLALRLIVEKARLGPAAVRIGLCSAADVASADRASHLAHGAAGLRAVRQALHARACCCAAAARRRAGARRSRRSTCSGAGAADLDSADELWISYYRVEQLVPAGARALGRSRHDARDRLDRARRRRCWLLACALPAQLPTAGRREPAFWGRWASPASSSSPACCRGSGNCRSSPRCSSPGAS